MFAPWEKASCFEGGCLWRRACRPRELRGAGCQVPAGAGEAGGRGLGLLPASCCNAARGGDLLNALHLLQPSLRALRHMGCKARSAWRVTGHPPGTSRVIPGLGMGAWQLLPGGQVGIGLRAPGAGADLAHSNNVGAQSLQSPVWTTEEVFLGGRGELCLCCCVC